MIRKTHDKPVRKQERRIKRQTKQNHRTPHFVDRKGVQECTQRERETCLVEEMAVTTTTVIMSPLLVPWVSGADAQQHCLG